MPRELVICCWSLSSTPPPGSKYRYLGASFRPVEGNTQAGPPSLPLTKPSYPLRLSSPDRTDRQHVAEDPALAQPRRAQFASPSSQAAEPPTASQEQRQGCMRVVPPAQGQGEAVMGITWCTVSTSTR